MISVIHDAGNFWLRDKLDIKIINLLGKYIEKPSILVLNKVSVFYIGRISVLFLLCFVL